MLHSLAPVGVRSASSAQLRTAGFRVLQSPDPLIQLTTLSRIHLLAGSTNRELALPAATERTNVSRNQIVIASGDGASEFGN